MHTQLGALGIVDCFCLGDERDDAHFIATSRARELVGLEDVPELWKSLFKQLQRPISPHPSLDYIHIAGIAQLDELCQLVRVARRLGRNRGWLRFSVRVNEGHFGAARVEDSDALVGMGGVVHATHTPWCHKRSGVGCYRVYVRGEKLTGCG